MNWRREFRALIGSIGFGAVTLGLFVVGSMYLADMERYRQESYLAGLLFFGLVIALSAFFAVLVYGSPFYFLFRRFGLNGVHYYLLVGLLPAVPVLIQNYPEAHAALRVATFGGVTATATWVARFYFFGHQPRGNGVNGQLAEGVSPNNAR